MPLINAATRLTGIVGFPVSHSLSPVMHNAAFEALSLNMVYLPFPLSPEDLARGVAGLAALGAVGFNVTIPHKVEIVPLLHEVTPEALVIGAVNTVAIREGRLFGYNTDGIGLLASLKEDVGFTPEGRAVLVLGAGGAARSAVAALGLSGAGGITVVNRTAAKGDELVHGVGAHLPAVTLASEPMERLADPGFLSGFDLVVNTTSVGMRGSAFSELALEGLSKEAAVYDMVYAPLETPLLNRARALGHKGANGIGMLVAQGEAAFQVWTGAAPPPGCMKRAVLAAIGAATP